MSRRMSERRPPSSTCCATARCTTRARCSTAGCPATTSPTSAARWPTGSPSTSRGADITYLVSSPLERAQETAAPSRRRSASTSSIDDRLIEAGNDFEGKTFGVGDGVAAPPGALAAPAQPVPPVVGRAVHRDRRADARRRRGRPRRGARPRGARRPPPAADLDRPVRSRPAGGSGTTRASGSARSRRSRRSPTTATTSCRSPTRSRPATCCRPARQAARSSSPAPDGSPSARLDSRRRGPGRGGRCWRWPAAPARSATPVRRTRATSPATAPCDGCAVLTSSGAGRSCTGHDAGPASRSTSPSHCAARSSWSTSGPRGARRASPRRPPCSRSTRRPRREGVAFVGIDTERRQAAAAGARAPVRRDLPEHRGPDGGRVLLALARHAAADRHAVARWCSTAQGRVAARVLGRVDASTPVAASIDDVRPVARRRHERRRPPSPTARCCSRCRSRWRPAWCRSSRRACCRSCPATSPT